MVAQTILASAFLYHYALTRRALLDCLAIDNIALALASGEADRPTTPVPLRAPIESEFDGLGKRSEVAALGLKAGLIEFTQLPFDFFTCSFAINQKRGIVGAVLDEPVHRPHRRDIVAHILVGARVELLSLAMPFTASAKRRRASNAKSFLLYSRILFCLNGRISRLCLAFV